VKAPVPLEPEARRWLAQPSLEPLWRRARERLERSGIAVAGQLELRDLDDAQRLALSGLLGRPVLGPRLRIAMADLDARLRATAAGGGLVEVVTELSGPLTDRRAQRQSAVTQRERLYGDAARSLASSGLGAAPWAATWLEGIRRAGTLGRYSHEVAARLLAQAIQTLTALLGEPHAASVGRGELAFQVTGSAHGLDDDTVLARLVLRALALRGGEDPSARLSPERRRALWHSAGVQTDEVSSTVLSLGLAPVGGGWREAWLRSRAVAGEEVHLTLRDLRRVRWQLPAGTLVRVCENPRVLEAAMDAGARAPLVCTEGSAAWVTLWLLRRLVEGGAALGYHGDFDWPGIELANRLHESLPILPWRMRADDYEQAASDAERRGAVLQPLSGQPVEARWDAELAAAMRSLGVTVHEESCLELLVQDLTGSGAGTIR
jgi:uncharacterized protein (TIGR02679 family)